MNETKCINDIANKLTDLMTEETKKIAQEKIFNFNNFDQMASYIINTLGIFIAQQLFILIRTSKIPPENKHELMLEIMKALTSESKTRCEKFLLNIDKLK